MTGEMGIKDRIAPVIIVGMRRRAGDLPAGQSRAGLGLGAIAQQHKRDAAFARRQSQPSAGHQVQAFGHAFHFQQHRAHMRTGQNVIRRRQGIHFIAGADLDQRLRITTQLQQPIGRARAIFHRLIIGPHPEEGFAFFFGRMGRRPQRQQRGKAACAPALREDFVQGTWAQSSTQHRICLWMTGGDRRPVRGQAVARQGMAQFHQFCAFVHAMFYNAPSRFGVNRNCFFGIHSQIAWVLIKLTHI